MPRAGVSPPARLAKGIASAGTMSATASRARENPSTVYSPPNPDGTVHKTKADADRAVEAEHHS